MVDVKTQNTDLAKTSSDFYLERDENNESRWRIGERIRERRSRRKDLTCLASVELPVRVSNFEHNLHRALNSGLRRAEAEREEQTAPKRRLSSAVVKVDGEEAKVAAAAAQVEDLRVQDSVAEIGASFVAENKRERIGSGQINGGIRRDGNVRLRKMDYDAIPTETVPRVLPKDDPNLVKRNRRMLGQLLGTLEKFREEDKQLSSTEAFMRRSDSLKRAEQKAREESERLRQQEREQISEKRRRDLTLRARVAAKAEEKKLELLFLFWAEHHKKLSNFLRTKAEPPIYYMPVKPLVQDAALQEQQNEQAFEEWKSLRRKELSKYQKQVEENYISNVDKEIERWQNARNARRSNNLVNLQASMDEDLDTHRLEHGPKTRMRNIRGGNDHDDEDVEDINTVEDELMDEVLEPHDRPEHPDPTKMPETGNGASSGPASIE
ncbi:hypothetical protein KSP40_PGU005193 [Platanthera guangdongensis]|uniref:Pinin/SDK/MemA protein domain-containing protein n=1 Tax=Platanthera guangdongensis TaxID=2320717 RepID=A0ABR2MZJ2_9ASPA